MAKHVHGMVVTGYAFSSNNRGVSEGNTSTLQKARYKGKLHVTISSEAIRYGVRADLTAQQLPVNRYHPETADGTNTNFAWHNGTFTESVEKAYADDDGMGYMTTQKGDEDNDKKKGKGSSRSRTSRFCVNRAVSLDPWFYDTTFNVSSPGATPGARTEKSQRATEETGQMHGAMYNAEFHATRFQYPFSMTPDAFLNPQYVKNYLLAVSHLTNIGGNQARYFYDFSPETILVRITDEPCPRFNYCFESDGNGGYNAHKLIALVESGDIKPSELHVGGFLATTPEGARLQKLGCHVYNGVRKCVEEVIKLLG